ncbi:DEAD/DEAH box helicase [Candidatus Pelagibacter sp.]|nr:DEAD/DEAH box helicase [Candidatus Pelagibacter sp.]
MENFKLFKIEDSLKDSLRKMNFTKPTPIQVMAIPVALEGRDILGTAQTGTGKTLAFSIPLINKLILDKNAFALVMCPTRELATQVMEAIRSIISDKIKIKTALLIGGEAMQKQLRQLGNRSRIIVGTPGRINDHLKRKSLNLSATKYLVLDETDRMLDMGFTPQIEMILKFIPKDHQTLLFSATLPQNILRISERYLNKPERISTGATSVPIAKIKQETLQVFKENKYDELIDQFLARKGSILVFVKTKRGADKMVKKLKEEGHSADAIHGDLRQSKRDRVINSFRKGLKRILIATDVAARGLDIPLIQHVINYDLPQVPEDYIHRIGRTARAGSEGSALTFLTPDDRLMWNSINKLIDPNFKPAPSGLRRDSKSKRRGRGPNNKKRKARDEKRSFGKGRQDRSLSFRDKPKSYGKGRSERSSRDGEKKSFGFKEKPSFRDKPKSYGKGRSERSSRDGEKKSFGFKEKPSFRDKPKSYGKGRSERSSRDGEKKSFGFKEKPSFRDKPKSYGKGRSERSSRDGEKKSFGFKEKPSFTKKNDSKPSGFTNNPKYFGRKPLENISSDSEKKSFGFKGKKKFKSRNSRPKSFSFKKHSKKRTKS